MRTLVVLMMLFISPLSAEEVVLRGSAIKAMEGVPAVSFVVPWQESMPSPYIAIPPLTVLDDYLQPLGSTLLPGAYQPLQGSVVAMPER